MFENKTTGNENMPPAENTDAENGMANTTADTTGTMPQNSLPQAAHSTNAEARFYPLPVESVSEWQDGMYGLWPTPAVPRARKRRHISTLVAALLALSIVALLFVIDQQTPAVAASTTTTSGVITAATDSTLTVTQIASAVRPAVVEITNMQTVTQSSLSGYGSGSTQSGTTQETGVGSGVIYDSAGYILTNDHVVDGATSLVVTLTDGRTFDGTVVGADTQTDLAVVKIDPKGTILPVATLGDSSQLQVGDGLVAIGNALDLSGGPSVTSGVVSALDRSVTEPASTTQSATGFGSAAASGPQLYGLIQTDAAINPGNSGGPLINMQGQVVGIDTLVAGTADSSGLQAEGIGFAISINEAKTIAQELVSSGKVVHAYLGIAYQPLTAALAKSAGVSVSQGAIVEQVQSGSPAASAGLKAGDIITQINGQALTGESQLGEVINNLKSGDNIQLQVITPQTNGGTGQAHSVSVTLSQKSTN